MKSVSSLLSIISFLMVINVAWLHSAARLGLQAGAPEWMKFVWGLSVPYFFVTAIFWQAKREFKTGARCLTLRASFDILGWEILRLVKRLLVPYFCWCWLGAVWSIALHGVQLKGWEALRYLGLQPGWDPAYQPMWFLKALFVVLCMECVLLNVGYFMTRRIRQDLNVYAPSAVQPDGIATSCIVCDKIRHLIFPIYVLHSMFMSLMSVFLDFSNAMTVSNLSFELGVAIVAVGLSVVCAVGLRKLTPRVAGVLFGGRE